MASTRSWFRLVVVPSIAALGGLLAGAGTVVATYNGWRASSPKTPVVQTPFPRTAKADLAFIQPASRNLPRCNYFSGTGTIPKDFSLLIFDIGTDANGKPDGKYYLDGVASSTGNGWRTPQVDAGARHTRVDGILVPRTLADFLLSIETVGPDGRGIDASWITDQLPLGAQIDPPLSIDPDLSSKPCP
jgi:hypothetical protein